MQNDHNQKQTHEKLIKQFNIKPSVVNLDETHFSKIGIKCSAKSNEKDVKLSCHLVQEGMNTFSLKIKRARCDDLIAEPLPLQKKPRTSNVMLGGKHF